MQDFADALTTTYEYIPPISTTSSHVTHKPMLIMHVGPIKTASTSLQDALTIYHKFLESDNYYYLGKVNKEYADNFRGREDVYRPFIYGCFWGDDGSVEFTQKCDKEQQLFTDILRDHLHAGHNVIMSDESMGRDLSEREWALLKQTFAGFDVKVVVAYRRYHEWLVSFYKHLFRDFKYHKYMKEFSDNGGARIPNFQDFIVNPNQWVSPLEGVSSVEAWAVAKPGHISARVRDSYQAHFSDVAIWNHHIPVDASNKPTAVTAVSKESNNVVLQFMCSVLPHADQTCAKMTKRWVMHSYKQGVNLLEKEFIAQRAHEICPRLSDMKRRDVFAGVKELFRRYKYDRYEKCAKESGDNMALCKLNKKIAFPVKCLDEGVKQIFWKQTMQSEKNMLPDFAASPDGQQSLWQSFSDQVASDKFCSIDLDKVFQPDYEALELLLRFGECKANPVL